MRDQFVFAAARSKVGQLPEDAILARLKTQKWPLEVDRKRSDRSVYLKHKDTLFKFRANEMMSSTHTFIALGDKEMNTVYYCMLYKAQVYVVWVVEVPQTEIKATLRIKIHPFHKDEATLEFNGTIKPIEKAPYKAIGFERIVSIIRQDMQVRINQRDFWEGAMDDILEGLGVEHSEWVNRITAGEEDDGGDNSAHRSPKKARHHDSAPPPSDARASGLNTGPAALHPVLTQDAKESAEQAWQEAKSRVEAQEALSRQTSNAQASVHAFNTGAAALHPVSSQDAMKSAKRVWREAIAFRVGAQDELERSRRATLLP